MMPVVYRLADIVTLPSVSETWGLAVNEALASGRRVLISDKVGCGPDLVRSVEDGEVFAWDDWDDFTTKVRGMLELQNDALNLRSRARKFDICVTEGTLCDALRQITRATSDHECSA
jgi:glycosyltransferase involved in cell wall biosynthesis